MFRRSLTVTACLGLAVALPPLRGAEPLPPLKPAELADLVESAHGRVKRIQVQYRLAYGSLGLPDPAKPFQLYSPEYQAFVRHALSRAFVPASPERSANAESACDLAAGRQYLRYTENDPADGKPMTWEFSYDGTKGMKRTAGPASHLGQVTISAGPPDEIRDPVSGYWRPERVTYVAIAGRELASAIREAVKTKVETETVDGCPTYRVTLMQATRSVGEVDGQPALDQSLDLYRYWLAPGFHMLPVRIDVLHYKSPEDMDGVPYAVYRQSDFREVQPGFWFPHRSSQLQLWTNAAPALTEAQVTSVAFNERAVIPDHIDVPEGVPVRDDVKGVKYRNGIRTEAVNQSVEEAMAKVREVRKSEGPAGGTTLPRRFWLAATALALLMALLTLTVVARRRSAAGGPHPAGNAPA